MKKFLTLVLFLIVFQVSAQTKQQHYCTGIWTTTVIAEKICWFDTICDFLQIDTTNPGNIWQRGTPNKSIFNEAYSAPYAMVTDTLNSYPNNNDSYFDIALPTIIDSSYFFSTNTTFSFMHRINTDTMKDGGFIEVKYQKDSEWENIAYDSPGVQYVVFNCENLYGVQDTLFNGEPGFSGSSGWVNTKFQWIWLMLAKKMAPDSIYLRFHFISDSINTSKDGWMIDNLDMIEYNQTGSIQENPSENLISVSPNPVSESAVVEIQIKGNDTYTGELYNIFGQKLKDFPEIINNTFTIERGIHESGIKFLVLKNESKILAVKKIIFL